MWGNAGFRSFPRRGRVQMAVALPHEEPPIWDSVAIALATSRSTIVPPSCRIGSRGTREWLFPGPSGDLDLARPSNALLRRSTRPTCFGVTFRRPFGVHGRLTEAKYLLGLPCGSCPHRGSGVHRRTGGCGSHLHRTGTTQDSSRGRPAANVRSLKLPCPAEHRARLASD